MTAEFGGLLEPLSVIRAIEDNLVAWYRLLVRLLPDAAIIEEPDMVRTVVPIHHPVFNAILQARFAHGTTAKRIADAVEPLRQRGLPGMWWVGPSTHPIDLAARLPAFGFLPTDTLVGMAMDLHQAAWKKVVPTVSLEQTVTEATSASELLAWSLPFSDGFGMRADTLAALAPVASVVPSEAERRVAGEAQRRPHMRFFLGRVGNEPVASAMLFVGAGVAGLYGVATVSQHRNRGHATALIRAVLDVASSEGIRTCILHATPMAVSVYRRLGFVEYCRLRTLTWQPRDT